MGGDGSCDKWQVGGETRGELRGTVGLRQVSFSQGNCNLVCVQRQEEEICEDRKMEDAKERRN